MSGDNFVLCLLNSDYCRIVQVCHEFCNSRLRRHEPRGLKRIHEALEDLSLIAVHQILVRIVMQITRHESCDELVPIKRVLRSKREVICFFSAASVAPDLLLPHRPRSRGLSPMQQGDERTWIEP